MLSQRIFHSSYDQKLDFYKARGNTANSALFPRYLNTRGTAKESVSGNTDNASTWYYATYNPGSIHEELCCYLECYDIEFVKRIAVTAGNFYQAILGEHYPPYCYGQVIVNQDYQFYARLSADIPKAYSLVDTFKRLISVDQYGVIDLSGLKKLMRMGVLS